MIDQDTDEQLRRRLRALSAVNEQLRAQLEATRDELQAAPRQQVAADPLDVRSPLRLVGLAPRRAALAEGWLARRADGGGGRLVLVETPDGTLHVLEGTVRRRVRSGLLAAAVEDLLGERRPISDTEIAALEEGAPIEVLEGSTGVPFVVLDGHRWRVRGLPLPHPVDQEVAASIAFGPDLDLPAAVTPRRAREATGWIAALEAGRGVSPRLVRDPSGATWVVEGGTRRAVRSGLLVPAIAAVIGAAGPIAADELEALEPAPDVEVLEARTGEPFVVLGGRRSRLVGFPVTYPVHQERADALPDGPAVDVSGTFRALRRDLTDRANTAIGERDRARRKLERVEARLDEARRAAARRRDDPDPVGEWRRLVAKRGGVAPALARLGERGARKALRKARRTVGR
jgi:hypothetical protein